MKSKIALAARILLGLVFTVFGLNGFLQFIPMPPPPQPAADFFTAMVKTGYFFSLLKVTEIVAGVMVLTGFFVPLGLVLLAPIIVQIFFFHLFLEGLPTMGMPVVLVIIEAYLAYIYKDSFKGVLAAKSDIS